jgi:hypothetical protein
VAGLAVFLAVHALWIVPIWFIAPLGLVLVEAHARLAAAPPRSAPSNAERP